MKLALISVSDKTYLSTLAQFLFAEDYKILSTGGTLKYLLNHTDSQYHNRIISVADYTGFPEILEGRVKTLHPKIYAGLLYNPENSNHQKDFESFNHSNHGQFNLERIHLVVCNLYPFQKVSGDSNSTSEQIIENIDIGGVSLIRAAAKNYQHVSLLVDPNKYQYYIENYKYYEMLESFQKKMASDGYEHIAEYDQAISSYFNNRIHYRKYKRLNTLKYGCNPYQNNSFVFTINNKPAPFEVIHGEPGYINYLDATHSWLLVSEAHQCLGQTCAASFKHTAPAGVALGNKLLSDLETQVFNVGDADVFQSCSSRAFIRARNCDPLSSFGDFIAISGLVDETCAKLIKREVSDGIIALDYTKDALNILKQKKGGKFYIFKGKSINYADIEFREIGGYALSQKSNSELVKPSYLQHIVTQETEITSEQKEDLLLATITLKYTPSNSITIAYQNMVIGVGAGQQNRVDCLKLAGRKSQVFLLRQHPLCLALQDKFIDGVKRQDKVNAIIKYINNDFSELELKQWMCLFQEGEITLLDDFVTEEYLNSMEGLSCSSDAFFPFRDNIDYAHKYGVRNILQPGGSVQDESVIEACDEYNMVMAFSGKRLFLH